ncbi:hypothetical protein GGI08_000776 [Coemansia sp. S2]|nr:hypothetical protein GGI08_000776 [Coemansia sp. S2]
MQSDASHFRASTDSQCRQQQHKLKVRAAERRQLQSVLVAIASERRQQQSALVARAVERHFDNALGQCNWEAVASELDTLLIEFLDLFDAADSTIGPRSLIRIYGGWSRTDMEKLKLFIADNYTNSSTVDWKLAGAYINSAIDATTIS